MTKASSGSISCGKVFRWNINIDLSFWLLVEHVIKTSQYFYTGNDFRRLLFKESSLLQKERKKVPNKHKSGGKIKAICRHLWLSVAVSVKGWTLVAH